MGYIRVILENIGIMEKEKGNYFFKGCGASSSSSPARKKYPAPRRA